jgi:hypothetical protein
VAGDFQNADFARAERHRRTQRDRDNGGIQSRSGDRTAFNPRRAQGNETGNVGSRHRISGGIGEGDGYLGKLKGRGTDNSRMAHLQAKGDDTFLAAVGQLIIHERSGDGKVV